MKTRDEYLALAEARIAEYPRIALLYQARDPRVLAMLDSMAAMLSMHSQEQDVSAMEIFTKARDVTVLADAALKGVLPFGTPKQSRLLITNVTATPFTVLTGRRVLDRKGRTWVVTVGASVPANGTASVTVIQQTEQVVTHTVAGSEAFYRIDLPAPDVGYLSGVRVAGVNGAVFSYTPEFTNIEIGQRIYQLETDENRTLSVVFGAAGLAGYQPVNNEQINITLQITEGDVDNDAGEAFAFEYAATVFESGAKITLSEVLAPGSAPMDIATMREVTSYPSLYDASAVYLGNFDFLLRRNLSPFRFLSVWNEQREEEVRGASVDNINRLFIAAMKDGVTSSSLRADIERLVRNADDSYRVRWVNVVESAIPVSVVLRVPDIYDSAAVTQQARELVLAQYGRDSAWAKRGSGRVLYRRVTSLIEDNVPACQAEAADVRVTVTDVETILPETYRYVSSDSLTITVETSDA